MQHLHTTVVKAIFLYRLKTNSIKASRKISHEVKIFYEKFYI